MEAEPGNYVYEFDTNAANDTARMWLVKRPMDLPSAEQYCMANGGHLASVHSARGLDQIRQVAARVTGYVWLGLVKGRSGYVWTDDTSVDLVRWGYGQPLGLGICTLLASWSNLAGSAYFMDVPCGLEMMFVCRFPVPA